MASHRYLVVALFATHAVLQTHSALAWGASAYRLVGGLASHALPADAPEFLRTPEAGRQIAEVARQPDWSRGDVNAANYVLVGDDLKISRGPALTALPDTRERYDAALRSAGSNQYAAGYLPYAIVDGWQLVSMDLAYWRADAAGARWAKTPAEQTWFLKDQYVREGMTIRDLGYLAHLVANGSEPLDVSVHANGWGNFPNPQNYSNAKDLRGRFEATVVGSHVAEKDIAPGMPAYHDCKCSIRQRVSDYLVATQKLVVPLYQIEKAGGFDDNKGDDRRFVIKRLAAATSELRDLVIDAWRASENMSVGTPPIAVRDIEVGKINGFESLRGSDWPARRNRRNG